MNDELKKALAEVLDERIEQIFERNFIKWFNQGFEEIVLPEIERIDKRLTSVENDLTQLKGHVERIESKLDRVIDKDLEQDGRLEKLEAKIFSN